jgi:hypothetical protein
VIRVRIFRLSEGRQRHLGDFDFQHLPTAGGFISVRTGDGRVTLNVTSMVYVSEPDADEPAVHVVAESVVDRMVNRSMM